MTQPSDPSKLSCSNMQGLPQRSKVFSNITEEEGLLTRNMSHDADFDTEVKDTFGKYGLDGIWERIDSWKEQPVDIAVSLYHSPKSACFSRNSAVHRSKAE